MPSKDWPTGQNVVDKESISLDYPSSFSCLARITLPSKETR